MKDWTDNIESFIPITATNDDGTVKVEWDYIGEGWYGDFDPTDPTDEPLLRFTVLTRENGDWEYAEDASYCTMNQIDTDEKDLIAMGLLIIERFSECVEEERSWKREMQVASHWFPNEWEVV